MNADEFLVFPLNQGQKTPKCRWKQYDYVPKKRIKGNYGLIPGLNNCCVIDLDFVKSIPDEIERKRIWDKHPLSSLLEQQTNTYTVKTPSGGLHYYFQLEEEFTFNAIHKEYFDILVNNSYVVGQGSYITKYGEYYDAIHDLPVAKMDQQLKDYILSLLTTSRTVSKSKNSKQYEINQGLYTNDFNFNMTEQEVEEVVQSLSKEFCQERSKWLHITVALKTLGYKNIWDKWSRSSPEKYNQIENNQTWNTVVPNQAMVFHMMNVAKSMNKCLKFSGGCKNVETNLSHKVDIQMNKRYLPKTTIKPDGNYLIKSDKGTGKSTCFLSYCERILKKNPKQKFISIVTRCALAKEQYRKAKDRLNIPITYYKDLEEAQGNWMSCIGKGTPPVWDFQFLITTPESYDKIFIGAFNSIEAKMDEFIVFIDEFNSVIEHIVTSSTLDSNRIVAFDRVVSTVSKAQQVICADADISPLCELFLHKLNKDYKYILNTYQPFKGVPVTFCDSLQLLICQITQAYNDKTPFFVMCDSKKNAEKIHKAIHNTDIKLVVSKNDYEDEQEDNDIDLQKTDYMIASPKIVYGLDSNRLKQRVVFAYYNGNTISPPQMVQQITRERSPREVHIFYDNPTTIQPKYNSMDDTKKLTQKAKLTYKIAMLDIMELYTVIDHEDFYSELLTHIEYINDAYNTSKYLHLRNCLEQSGFQIKNEFSTIERNTTKKNSGLVTTKVLFLEHMKNFQKSLKEGNMQSLRFLRKFGISPGDIIGDDEACQIFANSDLLKQYKIWKLLQLNPFQLETQIDQLKDFETNKSLNHQKTSILFCIECMEYFGINIDKIYYVPNNDPLTGVIKGKMERYVQFIYKNFNINSSLNNIRLYTYFRKTMMKLLPYGAFKLVKEKKIQVLCYNNYKQYVKQVKQNKIISTFKRIQSLQH